MITRMQSSLVSMTGLIALLLFVATAFAGTQTIPSTVRFEADEGGYVAGYSPIKKLGKVDLTSTASNEPFRHLIWGSAVPWDTNVDYRATGFKAMWANLSIWSNKPTHCAYIDLNEGSFKAGNPIYEPDPNRTGAGETFTGVNGPIPSVTISNIDEDSKWNPFLLTEQKLDEIARSICNSTIGFMRWDIESFNYEGWDSIIKGRQTWDGGKYRHKSNGGTDPEYMEMHDYDFNMRVQDRWSFVFSGLFFKTKEHSENKIKLWMYGMGPVGKLDPRFPQFNEKGEFVIKANGVKPVWYLTNSFNHRAVRDVLDYMEPWDMIVTDGMFGIACHPDPANESWWYSTDIIILKKPVQKKVTKGPPTRFSVTDLGAADNNMRNVRVSLHAEDGTLRVADKDVVVMFQDYHGAVHAPIAKGKHTVEMVVHPYEPYVEQEDGVVMLAWNNMYCQRFYEPQKLGFFNWEPTHRTESLFTTDLFEQRTYDAMVAFANLQNYGIVYWDANTVGRVNAMVRECLILANKKIAPYKKHIENQVLCQTGVSMDGGLTWAEPGYPENATSPTCYNGWWMTEQQRAGTPFPILMATYNPKQRTVLVAHMTNRREGTVKYKIKVSIPGIGANTFDLTSDKALTYTVFKAKKGAL